MVIINFLFILNKHVLYKYKYIYKMCKAIIIYTVIVLPNVSYERHSFVYNISGVIRPILLSYY